MNRNVFRVLAIGASCAAAYHVAGACGLIDSDSAPVWRHSVFVGVNLAAVWYFLRRPIAALPIFLLLFVQQLYAHGGRALRWWTNEGRVDVLSIVTLTFLSLAVILLVLDARERSPFVRRLVCPFPDGTLS
jgi:hypothetical protein